MNNSKKNSLILCFLFIVMLSLYLPLHGDMISYFHDDDQILLRRLSLINDISSAFDFVFSIDAFKFRPVANLIYLIEFILFNSHSNGYIVFNLVLNMICIAIVFDLIQNQSVVIKALTGLVICSSKYVIYSIWNITGSFEALSAILFLLTFRRIMRGQGDFLFVALSVLLILTSEKFLPYVVISPIIYSIVNRKSAAGLFRSFAYSIVVILSYVALRKFLSVPIFVATESRVMFDSFVLREHLYRYVLSLLELFGLSVGPKHLTGFEIPDWVTISQLASNSKFVAQFTFFSILAIFSYSVFLISACLTNRRRMASIFVMFLMLLPVSMAHRIELRWLFPSFLMFMLTITHTLNAGSTAVRFQVIYYRMTVVFLSFFVFCNLYYALRLRGSLYFSFEFDKSVLIN